MGKIKEILATTANKMAHKANDKQFEEYKDQLTERITKAASNGEFYLCVNTYSTRGRWEELKQWLETLGFIIGWNSHNLMAVIKWDDISIAKIKMMTEPKPATVEYYGPTPAGVSYAWNFANQQHDFVCCRCNKHSEYTTDYCPNCGAKMHVLNGEKERKYE